jgi:hypothetical protein
VRFRVEIEMGNEAMSTVGDVAFALEKTARKIRAYADPVQSGERGRVLDENGNAVGEWRFGR